MDLENLSLWNTKDLTVLQKVNDLVDSDEFDINTFINTRTVLDYAIKSNNYELFHRIIHRKDFKVNLFFYNNCSYLEYTIELDRKDMFVTLLDTFPMISLYKDRECKKSILLSIVEIEDETSCLFYVNTLLQKRGNRIHVQPFDLLYIQHASVFKILLHHCDVNKMMACTSTVDNKGYLGSLLHNIIEYGTHLTHEICNILVNHESTDVNMINTRKDTPIMTCIKIPNRYDEGSKYAMHEYYMFDALIKCGRCIVSDDEFITIINSIWTKQNPELWISSVLKSKYYKHSNITKYYIKTQEGEKIYLQKQFVDSLLDTNENGLLVKLPKLVKSKVFMKFYKQFFRTFQDKDNLCDDIMENVLSYIHPDIKIRKNSKRHMEQETQFSTKHTRLQGRTKKGKKLL